MKIKSRIVQQTVVTLNEADMEALKAEYVRLERMNDTETYPAISVMIGSLLRGGRTDES